jgi:hypothetical protein
MAAAQLHPMTKTVFLCHHSNKTPLQPKVWTAQPHDMAHSRCRQSTILSLSGKLTFSHAWLNNLLIDCRALSGFWSTEPQFCRVREIRFWSWHCLSTPARHNSARTLEIQTVCSNQSNVPTFNVMLVIWFHCCTFALLHSRFRGWFVAQQRVGKVKFWSWDCISVGVQSQF